VNRKTGKQTEHEGVAKQKLGQLLCPGSREETGTVLKIVIAGHISADPEKKVQ
jgi:hypothetical protein